MRRGSEYSIMIGGTELMNSRLSGSEEALATLAAERIGPRAAARVLIGGLGMGFTLRAALESLAPDAGVIVAELVPGVVDWARGPMADVFGQTLSDARVAIAVEDVAETIGRAFAAYDAILLDVDNGPGGLTRSGNDRLYGPEGLAASLRALTPGGILGIWSQGPDAAFTARLARAGFQVEEMRVKAGRGRGTKHVLWFAAKPAGLPWATVPGGSSAEPLKSGPSPLKTVQPLSTRNCRLSPYSECPKAAVETERHRIEQVALAVTGLNHITLAVADVPRSLAFYRDVLGCKPRAVWGEGAYLEAGNLWLCLSQDKDVRLTPHPDYTHIAFSVSDADYPSLRERIVASAAIWKDNRSEGSSTYFLDPDGHKLEIHVGSLETRLDHYRSHPDKGVDLFD